MAGVLIMSATEVETRQVSSIVTNQGIVHYEAYGRGAPVILLHGWINSWDVWRDTMLAIPELGRYKVYALDFWGFGESAKRNTAPFQIRSYAEMVRQFMEIMGIFQAPVFGHSMGGTVTLTLALQSPELITKAAIVDSPIHGNSLNLFLKLSGVSWIARLAWRFPFIKSIVMHTVLAGDSPRVRKMIFRDIDKANTESFFRSIGDLRRTDLRLQLESLAKPILGIFGVHDNIVNPNQAQLLISRVPHARIAMMQHSRHFPMLDEPDRFVGVIKEFLAAASPRP
jgi:pimeloyl-ACP methyl ester carboxylesterase